MSHTKFRFPRPKSRSKSKVKRLSLTNYASAITPKTNKENKIILHRKIKQNEKLCHAQNLVSYYEGQGHNRRSKVGHLQIVCQP